MTVVQTKISGFEKTKITLEAMEAGLTKTFKDHILIIESALLVKAIRQALERASIAVTGKKYWTGTLYNSIKLLEDTLDEAPGYFWVQVGADLTTVAITEKGRRFVGEYADVVELGLGHFPKPYAYTEIGYLTWKIGINERISKVLSRAIKTQWGYRSAATGRFTKV